MVRRPSLLEFVVEAVFGAIGPGRAMNRWYYGLTLRGKLAWGLGCAVAGVLIARFASRFAKPS